MTRELKSEPNPCFIASQIPNLAEDSMGDGKYSLGSQRKLQNKTKTYMRIIQKL